MLYLYLPNVFQIINLSLLIMSINASTQIDKIAKYLLITTLNNVKNVLLDNM